MLQAPLVGRPGPDLPSVLCIHTSAPHMASPLRHFTRSGNSVYANEVLYLSPQILFLPCFPSQEVNPPYTQLLKPETWKSFSVPPIPSPPAHSSSAVPSTRAPPISPICPQLTKCNPGRANVTSHLHISQCLSFHTAARMVFLGPKFHQGSLQPKIPQWFSIAQTLYHLGLPTSPTSSYTIFPSLTPATVTSQLFRDSKLFPASGPLHVMFS